MKLKTILVIGLAGFLAGNLGTVLFGSWTAGVFVSVLVWLGLGLASREKQENSVTRPEGWSAQAWANYLKARDGGE